MRAQGHKGRSIQIHPQEQLLQEDRGFHESAVLKESRHLTFRRFCNRGLGGDASPMVELLMDLRAEMTQPRMQPASVVEDLNAVEHVQARLVARAV